MLLWLSLAVAVACGIAAFLWAALTLTEPWEPPNPTPLPAKALLAVAIVAAAVFAYTLIR
jgi:hypothetical protein